MSSSFPPSVDFHISEQQRGEKENSGKFSEAPASAATLAITPAQQLIYQDHDTATIWWKTIVLLRFKMRALILSTLPLYQWYSVSCCKSEMTRVYIIISLKRASGSTIPSTSWNEIKVEVTWLRESHKKRVRPCSKTRHPDPPEWLSDYQPETVLQFSPCDMGSLRNHLTNQKPFCNIHLVIRAGFTTKRPTRNRFAIFTLWYGYPSQQWWMLRNQGFSQRQQIP